jgi:hypothetical protein
VRRGLKVAECLDEAACVIALSAADGHPSTQQP